MTQNSTPAARTLPTSTLDSLDLWLIEQDMAEHEDWTDPMEQEWRWA